MKETYELNVWEMQPNSTFIHSFIQVIICRSTKICVYVSYSEAVVTNVHHSSSAPLLTQGQVNGTSGLNFIKLVPCFTDEQRPLYSTT